MIQNNSFYVKSLVDKTITSAGNDYQQLCKSILRHKRASFKGVFGAAWKQIHCDIMTATHGSLTPFEGYVVRGYLNYHANDKITAYTYDQDEALYILRMAEISQSLADTGKWDGNFTFH